LNIAVTNVNDAPAFTADPIAGAGADEDVAYSDSLAGSASDIDAGDSLTYIKVSGPAWLAVASDGSLSGTPGNSDVGANDFVVRVVDSFNATDDAALNITINDVAGNGFTEWLAEYSLVAEPGDDSDHDSISNAVEYVIGGNPANQNNANLLPVSAPVIADPDGINGSSAYLLFTYRRTDRANNDPLTTIKVEWDTDFVGPWTNAAGSPGVVVVEENDEFAPGVDRVKVYLPRSLSPNGMLFARLSVLIEVPDTVAVPAYNQWMAGYNLTADPGTDSDGDTISNAVEYVIGGNPSNQPDANLLPKVALLSANLDGNPGNEDYLVFTYRRSDLANTDSATTIRVEWSTNLAGIWTHSAGTPGVVVTQDDNGAGPNIDFVHVHIPRSLAANGALFARLSVLVATP
jgi:hypothetical protein